MQFTARARTAASIEMLMTSGPRPKEPEQTWEQAVAASVRRALTGQTPEELVVCSCAVDEDRRHIQLRAHVSRPPSEAAIDDIEVVDTEVFTDFLDYFETDTEIEAVAPGAEPTPLPGGFVWRRGDPPRTPPAPSPHKPPE